MIETSSKATTLNSFQWVCFWLDQYIVIAEIKLNAVKPMKIELSVCKSKYLGPIVLKVLGK